MKYAAQTQNEKSANEYGANRRNMLRNRKLEVNRKVRFDSTFEIHLAS